MRRETCDSPQCGGRRSRTHLRRARLAWRLRSRAGRDCRARRRVPGTSHGPRESRTAATAAKAASAAGGAQRTTVRSSGVRTRARTPHRRVPKVPGWRTATAGAQAPAAWRPHFRRHFRSARAVRTPRARLWAARAHPAFRTTAVFGGERGRAEQGKGAGLLRPLALGEPIRPGTGGDWSAR